jgi:hypothetical protein
MPGFYVEGIYDLVGFIVGVVERSAIIDGTRIAPGDVLLGLPSSGLHTKVTHWRGRCSISTVTHRCSTDITKA